MYFATTRLVTSFSSCYAFIGMTPTPIYSEDASPSGFFWPPEGEDFDF